MRYFNNVKDLFWHFLCIRGCLEKLLKQKKIHNYVRSHMKLYKFKDTEIRGTTLIKTKQCIQSFILQESLI